MSEGLIVSKLRQISKQLTSSFSPVLCRHAYMASVGCRIVMSDSNYRRDSRNNRLSGGPFEMHDG